MVYRGGAFLGVKLLKKDQKGNPTKKGALHFVAATHKGFDAIRGRGSKVKGSDRMSRNRRVV